MDTRILSLVAPILAALITVGGVWWKEATQRRNAEEFRQRHLNRVKTEVEIIDIWAKAQASLASSAQMSEVARERARYDRDAAYGQMLRVAPVIRQSVTLHAVVLRLLLRHVRVTRTVRLLRYVYYSFLLMAFIWSLAGFSQPGAWNSVAGIFATLMTYLVVAVLPAWLMASIVISTSKRHVSDLRPQA